MSGAPAIAVLVSGTGRSLANLFEHIDAGRLPCRVGLVLSDRPGVRALDIAREHDVPTRVLEWGGHGGDVDACGRAAFDAIEEHGCRLVVLAGFLRLLRIPPAWEGRVLNVHPSLLPAFGGKGYYGHRVHGAVLARGVQFTGCTVHLVDDEYDHGRIILQRCIPVLPDDTPDSLAARVFEEEKRALPEAIRMVLGVTAPPDPP